MENVKKWWAPILMIAFGVIGLALGLTAVANDTLTIMSDTASATVPKFHSFTPNELFNQIEQWTMHDTGMTKALIAHTNMMFLGGIAAVVLGLASAIVGIVFTIKVKNDNVSNVKVMYGLVILPVAALAVGIGAIICNMDLGSEDYWTKLWNDELASPS